MGPLLGVTCEPSCCDEAYATAICFALQTIRSNWLDAAIKNCCCYNLLTLTSGKHWVKK